MSLALIKKETVNKIVHMLQMKRGEVGITIENTTNSCVGDVLIRITNTAESGWFRPRDGYLLHGDQASIHYPKVEILPAGSELNFVVQRV